MCNLCCCVVFYAVGGFCGVNNSSETMSTYLTEETLRGLVYDLQQALSDKNTEQALEILLSLSSSSVSATVLAVGFRGWCLERDK